MSRFFSPKYADLTPYTPGEQPRERSYIKLNTNESPFPPSPMALRMARQAAGNLNLYSDPTCLSLRKAAAEIFSVDADEVMFTNGSDDILNFAFMAFCDESHPAAFADITYGFYPVFAKLNRVPYETIPLAKDFSIRVEDYLGINKTIFIANPNAPTGRALPLADIERIIQSNPDSVVVVDEAYVDFGGESALPLIHKYDHLLVTRTFSKSRNLAGARLGMGFGCKQLIADLNTLRYSTNPYNINSVTMAAGIGALTDGDYFDFCRKQIMDTRAWTEKELHRLGFECLPSCTNFIFARHPNMGGGELYLSLKEKGILVRHFNDARIADFNRITIGSKEEMAALIHTLEGML